MNRSRIFNLVSVLFVFVLLITFTSTTTYADDCDEALFNYYEPLTSLMKYNQKAYGKIDGYLTAVKKRLRLIEYSRPKLRSLDQTESFRTMKRELY